MSSSTVLDLLPSGTAWIAVLVLAAAQGAMLLIVGFVLAAALRQAVAATRHLLWSLVLVGVLALPAASALVPWRVSIVPEEAFARLDALAAALAGESDDAAPAEAALSDVRAADVAVAALVTSLVEVERDVELAASAPAVSARSDMRESESASAVEDGSDAIVPAGAARRPLFGALLAIWLAGATLLLARLGGGAAALRGIVGRARPASETAWGWELQRIADREAGAVAIRLLQSDEVGMPLTTGVLHPTVILPSAADEWTPERRRAVLRHELAHVRRHDVLTHLLAKIACALHWPNPFVWGAARRMRAESERACDDLVLATGTQASEYAEHLLSIVRAAGRRHAPSPALPFAQRSDFEGRLLRILEPNVRRHGVTRGSAALVTLALAVTAIPLAAMGPRRAPSPPLSIGSLVVGAGADGMTPVDAQDPVSPTPTPTPTPRPVQPMDEPQPAPQPDPRPQPRPRPLQPMEPMQSRAGSSVASAAAIAGLTTALGDADVEVRRAAVSALGSLEDPRAIEALMQALRSDEDAEVRKAAAWALGQLEDRKAVPALTTALRQDGDIEVRKMSAWALGQIEDEGAVEALGAALGDQSAEVRSTSVWALGQIEAPASVRFLVPLLRDADAETRKQTAWALGQIESREAVGPLSAAVKDESIEVRETAVWALGQIEDPAAAGALAGALKDARADVRQKAAWALGQLDDLATAPPALIEALRDEDRNVRLGAAHALGEIEDAAAVPALREAARGDDATLRKTAVRALAEIDDPAAFDALVEMLQDDDPEVRRMAAQALGRNR
jgi:HEAT repeat protein/beta-lactamase regulating signal transducer with metallopeptidase domain